MATSSIQIGSKKMQEIDDDTTASTVVHIKFGPDNEKFDDEYAHPNPSPEPTSSMESSVSTAR
jgi:hypothetical protein